MRIGAIDRAAALALGLVLVLVLVLVTALAPAAASAVPARASLTDIEGDVMCTSCHEPLSVAQSPQADSERSYIRSLIAQGETKAQIERALVAQYGASVLALPPAHGFNLTVYILPPLILVVGIITLAITLPKWRRRARAASRTPLPAGPALDPGDARRLDEDLARRE